VLHKIRIVYLKKGSVSNELGPFLSPGLMNLNKYKY
jgi:hypothetical protein